MTTLVEMLNSKVMYKRILGGASDEGNVEQSLKEEKQAIKDYTRRAGESKNKKVKKVFKHNLGEEKEHARNLERVESGGPGSGRHPGDKSHENVLEKHGFRHHESVAGVKVFKKGSAEVSVTNGRWTARDKKMGVKEGTDHKDLEKHIPRMAAGGRITK